MTGQPERTATPVDFICVTAEHLEIGADVADGHGTLTTENGRWAYCTAGLHNARHEWKRLEGGVAFDAIHHAEVERLLAN